MKLRQPKIILRMDGKKEGSKRYPLYIQFLLNRKPAKASLGIELTEDEWDEQNEIVRKKHPEAARLNNIISKKRSKLITDIEDYESKHEDENMDIETLRSIVNGKCKDKDFIEFAKKYNDKRYQLGKIAKSTHRNREYLIEAFETYLVETKQLNSPIAYNRISPDILEDYIISRKAKNNNRETINKAIAPIILTLKELSDAEEYPLKNYLKIKEMYLEEDRVVEKDSDEDVKYLNDTQIEKLAQLYHRTPQARSRKHLDAFFFSINTGLRVSDIITLKWKHINFTKRILKKHLYKGNKDHSIVLNDAALDILNKYHSDKSEPEDFIFHYLRKGFDVNNKEEMEKARNSCTVLANKSLSFRGQKIGLPFNLRMHVGRHTFAVHALRTMRVDKVSHLLAHSSVDLTQKVYAKFIPDDIEAESREKLNFNFKP